MSFPVAFKTFKELVKEVKTDLNNNTDKIKKTCYSFFNFLTEKKILVPEDEIEHVDIKPPFLKQGDLFEGFEVLEILSDRGNIEIYLAVNKSNNLQRVIKLLNANKIEDADEYTEELSELETEYSMMKSVEHISEMCKAFKFEKNDKYTYIVLEHIQGISLSRYLHHTPNLSEEDCILIMEGFISGFAAMHESGLIHGDIHSSNVMVDNKNNIRIIDLGYSRKLSLEQNEVVSFGGVVNYMPPERIHIAKTRKYTHEADLYSDVYQVGILLYLVLYNTLPFDGFTWEELSKNIKEQKENYPENSFLSYSVNKQLIKIIKKCLEKKPKKRYKNAGGILKAFKKFAVNKELTVN